MLEESLKLCEKLMGPKPQVEVYSDNLTAVYLDSLSTRAGKLFRYKMFLNKFDIKVQHRQGKLNTVADMLSRLKYEGQPIVSMEEETDEHALISEAHDPLEPMLTGKVEEPPNLVCVGENWSGFPGVTPDRTGDVQGPDTMGFCMFNPPPGDSEPDLTSSFPFTEMVDTPDPTPQTVPDALPQHVSISDDHASNSDQQDQVDQSEGNSAIPLDKFVTDDHGPLFDDWEEIQSQQVLDIYSYVLRNTKMLALEQSTDTDSADLYQYKLDKSLPENLIRACQVMAEEDQYKMTEKGVLFRKFQPQAGQKMCFQLVLPTKYRFRITNLFHHGLHESHRGFHSLLHIA